MMPYKGFSPYRDIIVIAKIPCQELKPRMMLKTQIVKDRMLMTARREHNMKTKPEQQVSFHLSLKYRNHCISVGVAVTIFSVFLFHFKFSEHFNMDMNIFF